MKDKKKIIILRSTEDGYKINMLRLTIGSKENLKFMNAVKDIQINENILIIGCGLLGSSLIRKISKKKKKKKKKIKINY